MNRPYIVPLNQVRPGTVLIADGDFTCLSAGDRCVVKQDSWFRRHLPANVLAWFGLKPSDQGPAGSLYIDCADGHHSLDGQLNDEGTHLVGFIIDETPAEEEEYGSDLSDQEVISSEAELTEDVDAFKAGHRFTIMGLEAGKLRLVDDEGNVLLTERAKLKVVEWG